MKQQINGGAAVVGIFRRISRNDISALLLMVGRALRARNVKRIALGKNINAES